MSTPQQAPIGWPPSRAIDLTMPVGWKAEHYWLHRRSGRAFGIVVAIGPCFALGVEVIAREAKGVALIVGPMWIGFATLGRRADSKKRRAPPSMADRASYIQMKVAGLLAWNIVRWFPLPLGLSPRNPLYRASARLWGIAYTADAFKDLDHWLDCRRGEGGWA